MWRLIEPEIFNDSHHYWTVTGNKQFILLGLKEQTNPGAGITSVSLWGHATPENLEMHIWALLGKIRIYKLKKKRK